MFILHRKDAAMFCVLQLPVDPNTFLFFSLPKFLRLIVITFYPPRDTMFMHHEISIRGEKREKYNGLLGRELCLYID